MIIPSEIFSMNSASAPEIPRMIWRQDALYSEMETVRPMRHTLPPYYRGILPPRYFWAESLIPTLKSSSLGESGNGIEPGVVGTSNLYLHIPR